ncbi:hypothetical protein AAGG74_14510 [Bacillus mexicanus]|uniref:hypothetical protein n=1 Tax=Bacillus mexicanus TaxID=2834415 RepID=UPI003D22F368
MEKERFIRCLREMSEFLAYNSLKDPENNLGDWRAVKQELKNGDLQGLVYRKSTEINIIYSDFNERQLELFIKMKKQFEPQLNEALEDYCRHFKIEYPKESDITFTLSLEDIKAFEKFIYQYLLPTGK